MNDNVKHKQTWGHDVLHGLFGSQTRADIIAWFFAQPGRIAHAAKIARETNRPYPAVHRALKELKRLGILNAEAIGRMKIFSPNENSPLTPGLRMLASAAVGTVGRLADALSSARLAVSAAPVAVAFIFGSVAAGTDAPESDVDLMVIGEIGGMELASLCGEVEEQTGREVNPVSYTIPEFQARISESDSFITEVLAGPKIFLKGDEGTLAELSG